VYVHVHQIRINMFKELIHDFLVEYMQNS
jgi:cold shock CspA family protein